METEHARQGLMLTMNDELVHLLRLLRQQNVIQKISMKVPLEAESIKTPWG